MNTVWLLEANDSGGSSDDDFYPYLIFGCLEDVLDWNKDVIWTTVDSDMMRGSLDDVQYYASPWPVVGDN